VKYFDECVCVCVCLSFCLSARISPEPPVRSSPNFLCMLPMAMARFSSGRVTKSQGEGAVLEVFPIDSALYSIAFGTYTETAEPIDMPFGMMSELSPTNNVMWG